jgi:hypothetical protein
MVAEFAIQEDDSDAEDTKSVLAPSNIISTTKPDPKKQPPKTTSAVSDAGSDKNSERSERSNRSDRSHRSRHRRHRSRRSSDANSDAERSDGNSDARGGSDLGSDDQRKQSDDNFEINYQMYFNPEKQRQYKTYSEDDDDYQFRKSERSDRSDAGRSDAERSEGGRRSDAERSEGGRNKRRDRDRKRSDRSDRSRRSDRSQRSRRSDDLKVGRDDSKKGKRSLDARRNIIKKRELLEELKSLEKTGIELTDTFDMSSDMEDLETELLFCRRTRQIRVMHDQALKSFFNGAYYVDEYHGIFNPLNLQLRGIHQALLKNKDDISLDILRIVKRHVGESENPYVSIAVSVFLTILGTHVSNLTSQYAQDMMQHPDKYPQTMNYMSQFMGNIMKAFTGGGIGALFGGGQPQPAQPPGPQQPAPEQPLPNSPQGAPPQVTTTVQGSSPTVQQSGPPAGLSPDLKDLLTQQLPRFDPEPFARPTPTGEPVNKQRFGSSSGIGTTPPTATTNVPNNSDAFSVSTVSSAESIELQPTKVTTKKPRFASSTRSRKSVTL